MSHARIEEVSDSDPEIDDPDDFDPGDSIIVPAHNSNNNFPRPSPHTSSSSTSTRPLPTHQQQQPFAPPTSTSFLHASSPSGPRPNKDAIKTYQTLYPIYFDASRTRASGRRVPSSLAVHNPLARTLVDAVSSACGPTSQIAFEPDKLHPQDWANPGRVRVLLRHHNNNNTNTTNKNNKKVAVHAHVKNKRHLYRLVAQYLQAHPTTEHSPLELQIKGLPVPETRAAPAVPRGWKINAIVPLHSPAMSGGGVSENIFKDMMAEMQAGGGGPGGGEGGGGGGGGQGMGLPQGMADMLAGMGGMGAGSGGGSGGGGADQAKKKKDKEKKKLKA